MCLFGSSSLLPPLWLAARYYLFHSYVVVQQQQQLWWWFSGLSILMAHVAHSLLTRWNIIGHTTGKGCDEEEPKNVSLLFGNCCTILRTICPGSLLCIYYEVCDRQWRWGGIGLTIWLAMSPVGSAVWWRNHKNAQECKKSYETVIHGNYKVLLVLIEWISVGTVNTVGMPFFQSSQIETTIREYSFINTSSSLLLLLWMDCAPS